MYVVCRELVFHLLIKMDVEVIAFEMLITDVSVWLHSENRVR